jgi:hypothetical protein
MISMIEHQGRRNKRKKMRANDQIRTHVNDSHAQNRPMDFKSKFDTLSMRIWQLHHVSHKIYILPFRMQENLIIENKSNTKL